MGDRAWGIGESHQRELTAAELGDRLRVEGALGATFSPHCARVQPAKLVSGIAGAVERRGVRILEQTRATSIEPGVVTTERGAVRAGRILRCLEGYTAGIRGQRRTWLPMNSAMIVTEPLPDTVWDAIGWRGAELLGDNANAYCYAQQTADGRIALGGRGIPYRYGSGTDVDGQTQEWTIESLTGILHGLFPATRGSRIEHAWCGVLGVPRDWCASVTFDASTGLGWAGGYVGSGLTTTNLAGQHPRRSGAGSRLRPRTPAVGQPRRTPVGARAVALAGRTSDVRALPRGRSPRGQGPARPAGSRGSATS